jgi:hypothetical protein
MASLPGAAATQGIESTMKKAAVKTKMAIFVIGLSLPTILACCLVVRCRQILPWQHDDTIDPCLPLCSHGCDLLRVLVRQIDTLRAIFLKIVQFPIAHASRPIPLVLLGQRALVNRVATQHWDEALAFGRESG